MGLQPMLGALSLVMAGALASPRTPPPGRALVERRLASMGTSLEVSVVAESREAGLEASELVVAEMRRVEDLLTTWRDSPLSRVNAAAVGEEIAVGRELAAVLAEVFRWAARTDRAFDPTVAPLMRAWDLRGAGRVPAPEELAAALAATGPRNFRVESELGRAARLHPEAGIDEGAWGKGYALDRASACLAAAGFTDALVDLGGQTLAVGHDASAGEWRIPIAHPRDRERPVVLLSLANLSASTSANSERGRTVGGRRIGHEIDPRSGEPAPDFGSATVVAPSALVADVLSTAFFVCGPEKGLALSESLRREGVEQEVLFLIDRGGHLDALASPGFSAHVLSADPATVVGLTARTPPTTP
jgi:FAD:protein FMN transferase